MKYCINCSKEAEFIIQWGPEKDQKEYTCAPCMPTALSKIKAIEFYVVKIRKIVNKGN